MSTRPQRAKVLILIQHNDRGPWIEVYGEKHIDVHVRTVPTIGSKSGEILAEEFTDFALPRCFEELHRADYLRAHDVVREVKPSDMVDAYRYRQLLRGLGTVAQPAEEVLRWSA